MVYILFNLHTSMCGCDDQQVFKFKKEDVKNADGSLKTEFLSEYGYDLARDNAEMYGIDVDEDEDAFYFDYKELIDSEENIREEYGEVYEG